MNNTEYLNTFCREPGSDEWSPAAADAMRESFYPDPDPPRSAPPKWFVEQKTAKMARLRDSLQQDYSFEGPSTPGRIDDWLFVTEQYYTDREGKDEWLTAAAFPRCAMWAAMSSRTSTATLARLAKYTAEHGASDVHWFVADNPKTLVATLTELASDPNPYVRARVASHGKTLVSVLARLAQDRDARVRWCASQSIRTPRK